MEQEANLTNKERTARVSYSNEGSRWEGRIKSIFSIASYGTLDLARGFPFFLKGWGGDLRDFLWKGKQIWKSRYANETSLFLSEKAETENLEVKHRKGIQEKDIYSVGLCVCTYCRTDQYTLSLNSKEVERSKVLGSNLKSARMVNFAFAFNVSSHLGFLNGSLLQGPELKFR